MYAKSRYESLSGLLHRGLPRKNYHTRAIHKGQNLRGSASRTLGQQYMPIFADNNRSGCHGYSVGMRRFLHRCPRFLPKTCNESMATEQERGHVLLQQATNIALNIGTLLPGSSTNHDRLVTVARKERRYLGRRAPHNPTPPTAFRRGHKTCWARAWLEWDAVQVGAFGIDGFEQQAYGEVGTIYCMASPGRQVAQETDTSSTTDANLSQCPASCNSPLSQYYHSVHVASKTHPDIKVSYLSHIPIAVVFHALQ